MRHPTNSLASCACAACPARPREGLSRRAFLKGVTAAATTVPLAGCDQVDLGWLADLLVPPEAAEELGRQAFQQILSKTRAAQDPRLQAYVTQVGEKIVQASDSPYRDWEFVVLEGAQPNAFALPGGRVGVYTGMLQVAVNEAQLATVLGHEVGHVNARHGVERIATEDFISLALRVAAALFALGDVQIPPDLLVALGASAAEFGVVRPFSRAQELEADALGLEYMARAGFEPTEAVAFWRRMQQLAGDDAPRPSLPPIRPTSAASESCSSSCLRSEAASEPGTPCNVRNGVARGTKSATMRLCDVSISAASP